MGERIPTIYHVEGSDDMEENRLAAERKHKYASFMKADTLVAGERIERKEKHIKMYDSAFETVSSLMNKFGYDAKSIDISHIHFVEDEDVQQMEINLGYFRSSDNSIVVMDQKSDLDTYQTLVHELLHYQSFSTLTYNPETEGYSKTRVGFSHDSYNKETNSWERKLNILNEALTELYSIEAIDNSYQQKKDEYVFELVEDVFKNDPNLNFARNITESISPKITTKSGYWEEIKLLRNLKIFIGDKDNIFSQDLADGYFGGNTLKVARRLDKSFGKGFFHKLTQDLNISEYGKSIKDRIEELEKLNNNLEI